MTTVTTRDYVFSLSLMVEVPFDDGAGIAVGVYVDHVGKVHWPKQFVVTDPELLTDVNEAIRVAAMTWLRGMLVTWERHDADTKRVVDEALRRFFTPPETPQ